MNIIITGSSRGLGASIAKEWCKRKPNNFYYGISKWNDYDVSNYEQMREYYNNRFDGDNVTALVNNAGIIKLGSILELSKEDWEEQINTNLNGVFYNCKGYASFCIRNKIPGKIINIASTAGQGARPGRSAYSSSKAAVINFSLSIAEELKQYGIKVYCVCPGAIDTDMRHYINPDDDFDSMMKPDQLASFICDLIENDKYLHSQVLTIKNIN